MELWPPGRRAVAARRPRAAGPWQAVSEPEKNERGSSLIGRRTHFSSKRKGLWSKAQETVVMREWRNENVRCNQIFSFQTLSRNKKIYSKLFNEKGQELRKLWETNLLTTSPILWSVRYIISDWLFIEAFHANLQRFKWRRHVRGPSIWPIFFLDTKSTC